MKKTVKDTKIQKWKMDMSRVKNAENQSIESKRSTSTGPDINVISYKVMHTNYIYNLHFTFPCSMPNN